jgi:hypothetical protein
MMLACQKDANLMEVSTRPPSVPATQLNINLKHLFGNDTLKLNEFYSESVNGSVSIGVCMYYFTNIILIDSGNSETILPETYFLVDELRSASKSIHVNIPEGTYKAIRFMIGVDPDRNIGGIQSGDLDPKLGMFWTWVSGYIQAKLEGTFINLSGVNEYIHHAGGFTEPYSAVQTVELPFDSVKKVQQSQTLQVTMKVDFEKWFNSTHQIVLTTLPVVIDPGPDAHKVAQNYRNMFSIHRVDVQ